VDSLATDPAVRRRGAAQALLDEAASEARARSLPAVTLDTTINNDAARALYARAGFDEVAYRAATRRLPGFVALVRPVGRTD
jgi:[ribosomal protein S18]-alanine N-acetyltransferase